ncbi:hypothetical protein CR513_40383, partial [Mucuna pruriens]
MFIFDAMIPVEIKEPSLRRSSFDPMENPSSLWTDLDLVEEAKEQTSLPFIALTRFHRAPIGPSTPSEETLKHPNVYALVEHPLKPPDPSEEMLKYPKVYAFIEHPVRPLGF